MFMQTFIKLCAPVHEFTMYRVNKLFVPSRNGKKSEKADPVTFSLSLSLSLSLSV